MSKNKETPIELYEWFREYIAKVDWKFAKSYGKTAPHEYTVREWNPDLDHEFSQAVEIIRTYGYPERFWTKVNWYYQVDDLKYWTMGYPNINDPEHGTIIINRASVDTVYGNQKDIEEFDRKAPF